MRGRMQGSTSLSFSTNENETIAVLKCAIRLAETIRNIIST